MTPFGPLIVYGDPCFCSPNKPSHSVSKMNPPQQQEALVQCRSGIVALRQGQLLPALKEMRAALETFKGKLDDYNRQDRPRIVSLPSIAPLFVGPELAAKSKHTSPNNDFSVCLRCFDLTFDDYSDTDVVATILMYNFAFAMHLYGLNTGKSCHLQRAMVLYKKTEALIEHHGDERFALMSLALWTNLCYLLSHFLEHHEVHRCQENISFLLSHRSCTIADSDVVFFSSMLIHDFANNCRNAAAA